MHIYVFITFLQLKDYFCCPTKIEFPPGDKDGAEDPNATGSCQMPLDILNKALEIKPSV